MVLWSTIILPTYYPTTYYLLLLTPYYRRTYCVPLDPPPLPSPARRRRHLDLHPPPPKKVRGWRVRPFHRPPSPPPPPPSSPGRGVCGREILFFYSSWADETSAGICMIRQPERPFSPSLSFFLFLPVLRGTRPADYRSDKKPGLRRPVLRAGKKKEEYCCYSATTTE